MSRSPINGDVITFCGKGMENLASIDAGRLRIHIGTKPRMSAKPSAWPVVEESAPPAQAAPLQSKEVVLEMQPLPACRQQEPCVEGLQGWVIALGYTLFGAAMALTNLLTLPQSGLVCSLACPLPMLCLWAQAFAVAGLDRRRPSLGAALACCALPLPVACAQWSLALGSPLIVLLAGLQALACRHWGGVVCFMLSVAALCLALAPVQGLEPKWGATLSLFFLVLGCVLASLGAGRVVFRVRFMV